MLSSAVQCSLSEDGLLKDSKQKPELTVKSAVPASTEIECTMDGSDTDSKTFSPQTIALTREAKLWEDTRDCQGNWRVECRIQQ